MHYSTLIIAVAVLALGAITENAPAQSASLSNVKPRFFVAPDGNDANPGTKAKPFATLEQARDAVRGYRAKSNRPAGSPPIVVAVRGGTYFLSQTFVLNPEDSGTPNEPIIYQSYGNEKPVFSGGQRITGWKVANGRWTTTIPEVAAGKWNFAQLFVNGARRNRPRLPEKGYFYIQSDMEPSEANKGKGFDRFGFKSGDIRADWHNLGDVEVVGFHIWSASRMRLAAVDETENIVNFTGTTQGTEYWTKWPRGGRYLVDNVREALNKPGEWYLDRKSGELTYLPLPGENPQTTEVIAPRLPRLVEFNGDVAGKKWVQNVTLRGLHFRGANWTTPPGGQTTPQAESNLGAAIYATGARDCALENGSISHVGEYAIWLAKGCKRNRVENCDMVDLAGGGVKIGEMAAFDDEDEVASDNIVRDCLIAHGGRLHSAAIGVWIGHSPNNKVLHNEIFDFYYTGISPGWSWGYARSLSHHNEIAYNHIHQIGQGVLSDMGGIYTLGAGEGNHLHHNLIHDVDSFSYGGWGLYFDEGTSKIVAENNVVYNTKSAGFHQHYGKENVVRNNIFVFGREAQLMRTRPEPEHFTLDINHNIVLYKDAPLLGSNWEGDNYKFENNVYWRLDNKPVTFPKNTTLEQWQAKGQDKNSLVADPLFVDAARYDFRLKPDSPALKIGFQPIDVSTAGRTTAPAYTGTMPRAFPGYEPPPVLPIEQDFEKVVVGAKVPNAFTNEDNEQATARVSDETAATGKHSLKFTDAPGGKFQYNPHVYWEPHFKSGLATSSFYLRPETGAQISHEWRDNGGPYHVGPAIYIEGEGTLKVGGQKFAQLPLGAWTKFDMSCALGDGANAQWNLTVTLPNQAPISGKFTCDKDFRSLDWLGFTSNANDESVFYLDDLKVLPGK